MVVQLSRRSKNKRDFFPVHCIYIFCMCWPQPQVVHFPKGTIFHLATVLLQCGSSVATVFVQCGYSVQRRLQMEGLGYTPSPASRCCPSRAMKCLQMTSSLTFKVAGVAKNVATMLIGVMLGERVSAGQAFGYGIATAATIYYSVLRQPRLGQHVKTA
jgi:hypothetical protein